jgi:hypothetical protein
MTGIEALQLLRKGKAKVARSIWMPNELLYTFADEEAIFPSYEYLRRYPNSNAFDLITSILSEFLHDDWEVVD